MAAAKKAKKAEPDGRSALQEAERRKHQEWLNWLRDEKGKALSALASEANISSNTLTRNFAKPGALLDSLTIAVLRDHWKVEGPETYRLPGRGGYPPEALPFDSVKFPEVRDAVTALLKSRPALQAYLLNTRALEYSGYAPDDVVIVDPERHPEAFQAVLAIRSPSTGQEQLIFRMLEQPFLRADCGDPALKKPVHISDGIKIVGPIVSQFRQRLV